MKSHDTLDTKLAATRPTLTTDAKAALLTRIEAATTPTAAPVRTYVVSPYLAYLRRPVALALVVVLSVTSLTTAAQAAKPGDTLFVVEQLSEELRYLVTPVRLRGELRVSFAEQRLRELQRIVGAADTDTAAAEETERVSRAVRALLAELDAVSDDTSREAVAGELLASLDPATVRARVSDDRFEIRDDTVRIRFKDGEWRYRYDDSKTDRRDGDDDDDEDEDDRDDRDEDDRETRKDGRGDFRWPVTNSARPALSTEDSVWHDDHDDEDAEDDRDGEHDEDRDTRDDRRDRDGDDDRDEEDSDSRNDDTREADRDGTDDDASRDDSGDRDEDKDDDERDTSGRDDDRDADDIDDDRDDDSDKDDDDRRG